MGKTGIIIALVLILIVGGFYILISTGKVPNPFSKKPAQSLGEQIYTQTQNLLEEKLPETNPFAKVNPFKGVYKNPFQ